MKSCKDLCAMLLLVSSICSCAHPRPSATEPRLVMVASIADGSMGLDTRRIGSALQKIGIHCLIYGSNSSYILVPANKKTEATLALKQDAQVHKYEITFY
jgi:hypothetical protein